ncbi:hypothetical protein ACJ41O_001264 [Fusarium nematophilum]
MYPLRVITELAVENGLTLEELILPGGVLHGVSYTYKKLTAAREVLQTSIKARKESTAAAELDGKGGDANAVIHVLQSGDPYNDNPSCPGDKDHEVLDDPDAPPTETAKPPITVDGKQGGSDSIIDLTSSNHFASTPSSPSSETIALDHWGQPMPMEWDLVEDEQVMASVARLLGQQKLSDTVIHNMLTCLLSLRPLDAVSVDPLKIDQPFHHSLDRQLSQSVILAPIFIPKMKHWALAVIKAPGSLQVYDSLADREYPELHERVLVLRDGLLKDSPLQRFIEWNHVAVARCPRQDNWVDCGVAVLVNAIYILAGRTPPSENDYMLWRRVLASLFLTEKGFSLWEDKHLSLRVPHLRGKPVVAIPDELAAKLGCLLQEPCSPRPSTNWIDSHDCLGAITQSVVAQSADFVAQCDRGVRLIGEIIQVLKDLAQWDQPLRLSTRSEADRLPSREYMSPLERLAQDRCTLQDALDRIQTCAFRSPQMEWRVEETIQRLDDQAWHHEAFRERLGKLVLQYEKDRAELAKTRKAVEETIGGMKKVDWLRVC